MPNEEKLIVSFDDFVDSLDLEPKIDFETYSEQLVKLCLQTKLT